MRKVVLTIIFSVTILSLFTINNLEESFGLTPTYRTIDGTGNHPSNQGQANQPLIRATTVGYQGDVDIPRGGDPSSLPSARAISNAVSAQSSSIPEPSGANDMFWLWGQFLDHDMDLTGGTNDHFDILVDCGDVFFDPGLSPPDPMDSSHCNGNVVIPLTRSVFTTVSDVRQQTNQITAFIDGSNVYGSDQVRNDFIRDVGGKLKLNSGLLPKNTLDLDNANANPFLNFDDLFLAGDVRANEHVGLTAMHTIFVREHNTIVDELKDKLGIVNPTPSEADELYQKARAILEGKMQYITYNEFLPILLGPNAITPYSGYDSSVDPQIANEFSTAAYRVGHTMLSTELERREWNGVVSPGGHLSLSGAFFNPSFLTNEEIDRLMRGLVSGSAERVDTLIIGDVRNFLFGPPGSGGFDLASLNIQRGRDHGLPSYNDARVALGLPAATNFVDITTDAVIVSALQSVYNNVDEVDLWIGGLAETPVPNAMVGETFFAILKDQFERSRDGDRYWYENRYADGDLTDMELMMIETSSLADIIMRNSGIQFMNQNVYLTADLDDSDFDTVMNYLDNCIDVWNEDQFDINANGIGDVCEPNPVGGEMILVDTSVLVLAGAQNTVAWLIPVIVSAIGIGIIIQRKL